MSLDVTVVIAQWGQSNLTLNCVESLLDHHPRSPEIIVVDDGSAKRDLLTLQRRCWNSVQIVRLPQNRGTTVAWNSGAARSTREAIIFLNNDCVSTGAWCEQLTAPLFESTSTRLGNARFHRLTGPAVRSEPELPDSLQVTFPVTQLIAGWCMAMRKESFAQLGCFDERFRLYFSDTDLQCRILRDAYNLQECAADDSESHQLFAPEDRLNPGDVLQQVPNLPIHHSGHRTTRRFAKPREQWQRDRDRFYQKWSPAALSQT